MNNLIQSMLHHLPNSFYEEYSNWYENINNIQEKMEFLVCLLRRIDDCYYNEYSPEVQKILRKHNTDIDKITSKLLNDACWAEDQEYDDIEI